MNYYSALKFITLCLLMPWWLVGQNGTVRGRVLDAQSDEPIAFANAVLKGSGIGAVASIDGLYVINNVPPGEYQLEVSFVGYGTKVVEIAVESNRITQQNVYLQESAEVLETVEVTAERRQREIKVNTSVVNLDPKEVKRFSVGGDADLIKAIQVLPGVITTGDQGGQLFIRGGAPIQNLILLDGMVLYNPFHSIGFFSVFDNDIIRSADVYSGGFGAEYSSRNSAVMDVRTRSGNRKRFAGNASVSPYLAKLLLEAPLGARDDRGQAASSILVSAKTSYLDQTAPIFYPYAETEFDGLPFSFTDLYAKYTAQSDNGSQFNLFGFNFDDAVRFGGQNSIAWNSRGLGMNFTAIPPTSTVLIDGSLAFSTYDIGATEGRLNRQSAVNSFNGGLDFTYFLAGNDEFKMGFQTITYTTDFEVNSPLARTINERQNTSEIGGYAKYRYSSNRLIVEPGLRVHYYSSQGEASIEPRFGLKYNVNSWLRFKGSGGWYSQNLMAGYNDFDVVNLFYGFLSAPRETQLQDELRGEEITSSLQKATHIVVGLEVELTKELTLNLEAYRKNFNQVINLNRNKVYDANSAAAVGQPGILVNDYLAERGLAQGIDLLLKYSSKQVYVWLAYSLGEVTRDDDIREYFPSFDRRHNLNLITNYKWGKDNHWETGLRYNFGTGFPFTPTQLFYSQQPFTDDRGQPSLDYDYTTENGQPGVLYAELNTRRLPNYHRVDWSITRNFKFSETQNLEVSLGATNIMNYRNIFFFNRDDNRRVDQLPIMPTLSLNYGF